MNIATVPVSALKTRASRPADGEGSVQVPLDPFQVNIMGTEQKLDQ